MNFFRRFRIERKKPESLIQLLLFNCFITTSILLSGCKPDVLVQTLPTATEIINVNSPTQTSTVYLTATNVTSITPTVIATPPHIPLPIRGPYIRYSGYNIIEKHFYCGIMSVDGKIFEQRVSRSGGDPDQLAPPYLCPDGGGNKGDPVWSPNGNYYIYLYTDFVGTKGAVKLFLGKKDSIKLTHLETFYEDTSDLSKASIAPQIKWLTNEKLFYFLYETKQLVVFDLVTKKKVIIADYAAYQDNFHYMNPVPSPDGKWIFLRYSVSQLDSHYEVINVNTAERKDLKKAIEDEYLFQDNMFTIPSWSSDSLKIAHIAKKGSEYVWLIFGNTGNLLSAISPPPGMAFDGLKNWDPDSKKLLVGCSDKLGQYYPCLVNENAKVVVINPDLQWNQSNLIEWSQDSRYLYYFTGAGAIVTLNRFDLDTAEKLVIADKVFDYSRINDQYKSEWYQLSKIDWSFDKEWLILNNSGPSVNLERFDGDPLSFTTSMICRVEEICQIVKFDPLIILGAEWWVPNEGWIGGSFVDKFNPNNGGIIYEDSFSQLDTRVWKSSGNVTAIGSKASARLILDGSIEEASIEKRTYIQPGNSVQIDLIYTSDVTRFVCGLFDSGRKLGITFFSDGWQGTSFMDLDFSSQNDQYRDGERINSKPSRWYTIHLRIASDNQLQAIFFDKANQIEIGGLNINIGSDYLRGEYKYFCKVNNGKIELANFKEKSYNNSDTSMLNSNNP